MSLENARCLIQKGLSKMIDYIANSIQPEEDIIRELIEYLLQQQGKQIRPQLVLAVALLLKKNITEKTLRGAALISLLHHASLMHDDVVDEATYRRYAKTFNTVWSNKIAILFGDYILASILHLAVQNKDYEYLSILTKTVQVMSEGEIIQLSHAKESIINERIYLEIIRKKTASLLGASCAIGAISVAASAEHIEMVYRIGEHLGMAFQIKDDLLDYEIGKDIGKETFMDLKAQKLTLPLIYALQQAQPFEKQAILKTIQQAPNCPGTFQQVLLFVNKFEGIGYTVKKMTFYQQEAIQLLENNIVPSIYRDLFALLIKEMLHT
jgi:octaprenyl-diphosphate synthase